MVAPCAPTRPAPGPVLRGPTGPVRRSGGAVRGGGGALGSCLLTRLFRGVAPHWWAIHGAVPTWKAQPQLPYGGSVAHLARTDGNAHASRCRSVRSGQRIGAPAVRRVGGEKGLAMRARVWGVDVMCCFGNAWTYQYVLAMLWPTAISGCDWRRAMTGSLERERERVKACKAAEVRARAPRGACSFSCGHRNCCTCGRSRV